MLAPSKRGEWPNGVFSTIGAYHPRMRRSAQHICVSWRQSKQHRFFSEGVRVIGEDLGGPDHRTQSRAQLRFDFARPHFSSREGQP
eukprot:2314994-Lingulodinium_polyedra.AAC.1